MGRPLLYEDTHNCIGFITHQLYLRFLIQVHSSIRKNSNYFCFPGTSYPLHDRFHLKIDPCKLLKQNNYTKYRSDGTFIFCIEDCDFAATVMFQYVCHSRLQGKVKITAFMCKI